MKRAVRRIGLLACLAAILLLLLIGLRRPSPVSIASLGWNVSVSPDTTNESASIQITNRTAQAMAVGLGVQALNQYGIWEPVPEKLVFEPDVAGRMIVVPGSSSTNLTLKWLPERGSAWRVHGEYQKVLSQREGTMLQLMWKFGLVYPFVKEGQIAPQEIGAPNPR
jgi:hypothetical protein